MLQKIIKKSADIAVEHPIIIISIFILITAFSIYNLQFLEVDTAIKSMIPDDMPSRVKIDKIESIFGGTEMVQLTIQGDDVLKPQLLKKMQYISNELEKLKEVDKVNSPFTVNTIEGKNNELLIENAVSQIPENNSQKEALKNRLQDSELVMGKVFSSDFKAANISVILSDEYSDNLLLEKINNILDKADQQFASQAEIFKSGLPIIRALNAEMMQRDMRILMPLGLIIMLVFLFLCFKQLRGVLLPFAVVVMSILFSFALIPLLGWKFQLITIILPVVLIAVTNDYGIHIIAEYQELAASEEMDGTLISRKSLLMLGAPVAASGITTIVGLMSLSSHIIVPAKQMGILAGAGIAFALTASIFFLPAVLSLLEVKTPLEEDRSAAYLRGELEGVSLEKADSSEKNDKAVNAENQNKMSEQILNTGQSRSGLIRRILINTARIVTRRPKTIVITTLLLLILLSFGIFQLQVDTNPISFYEEDSEIVKANNIVNKYFGGANSISIVAEGNMQSAEVMGKISEFGIRVEEFENISQVSSIAEIMRIMNRELHNGDPEYEKIPEIDNAVSQYLLLFSMSGSLDKLLDFNREHALLIAQIPSNSTNKIREALNKIKAEINEIENNIFILVGGFGDLLADLVNAVVKGQIISLIVSVLLVAVVVMLLFGSFTAGIFASIPLITALISLFSLMGYLNINLDMITAMLSSIMIGVGVDYTIHFLWRYRIEHQKLESRKAVVKTLATSGRGITFNALSVIVGFSLLFVSSFLPIKFFAFLVTVSIAACLLGALVILPAAVIIFEPDFLESDNDKFLNY